MRIVVKVCLALLSCCSAMSMVVLAQGQSGRIHVPDSSIERPEDVGRRMHTNHLIFLRSGGGVTISSPSGETPESLACVYKLVSNPVAGCPVKYTAPFNNPNGGLGTIAIVDAFDYPTAENDLNVFSQKFGLPACTTAGGCFKKVYAKGVKPKANCGWAQEAALDIEWAHAMAPNATIVLVEAASNSYSDLFSAVDVAYNEVICGNTTCPAGGSGVGEVSMSWGGSESSSEASYDSHFANTSTKLAKPGVVFFAASGDSGGKVIYPSASPYVVSAGGTTVNRASGSFQSETAWSGSGGGPSKYEERPSYQDAIVTIVGSHRGTPDFSFDANPSTGVSVYDSTSCQGLSGWLTFGGTSVSSPSLAGIVNLAEGGKSQSADTELSTIYSNLGPDGLPNSNLRDITSGTAGSFTAKAGWDFVTGVGSNQGTGGK